jgi:hypothetical protein
MTKHCQQGQQGLILGVLNVRGSHRSPAMIGDTTYKVYCLVQGDSKPFSVTTSNGDVSDLMELVLKKGIGSHRDILAKDLVLWKVGLFNSQHKPPHFLLVAP